jgi:hypothetical protein
MPEEPRIRAERCIELVTAFLARYPEPEFERCVDLINGYFDADTFEFAQTSQQSFRVRCDCGWSFSAMLPFDVALAMIARQRSVKQIVFHFETNHGPIAS